eukprot:CAMPEP_0185841706 /NCGR_PEP_ID=MMETSP1353-20130828/18028_1 /TAXON_ID=1077150 /ORGANISM="Erythrolobus australicus, Strain CCMP3124" /LENGTH=189 /DNA_ID=CAMNT_0028541189 /DNA_START=249 /DNA_END=818 /DNA_ORIENTATION=-
MGLSLKWVALFRRESRDGALSAGSEMEAERARECEGGGADGTASSSVTTSPCSPLRKETSDRVSLSSRLSSQSKRKGFVKFASERMSSFAEPLSVEEKHASTDFAKVAGRAQKSLKCVSREVAGTRYSSTFLARELLSWLVAKKICASHNEALYFCQQLLSQGLILRVGDTNDEPKFTFDLVPYYFALH